MLSELVQDHSAGVIAAGVHDDVAVGILHRGENGRVESLELGAVLPVVGVGIDADARLAHGLCQLAAAEIRIFDVQVAQRDILDVRVLRIAHRGEGVGQGDGDFGLSAAEVACNDDDTRAVGDIF